MSRARNVANPTQITIPVTVSANLSTNAAISIGNTTVNTAITSSSLTTTSNTVTIGTAAYFVANGNVGIGISVPSTKLTISNNPTLPSAGAVTSTNLWQVSSDAATNVTLFDSFGSHTNIIGRRAQGTVSSPSAIQSSSLIAIDGRGYGATGYSAARVEMRFQGNETWTDSAQGTRITFSTTANGTTTMSERVRIDSDGNVGIGTTAPKSGSRLTVTGGAIDTDNGTSSTFRLWNSSTLLGGFGTSAWALGLGAGSGLTMLVSGAEPLIFATNNAERMRITSGGNVGINTTSPNISGQVSDARVLTISGSSTSWGGVEVNNSFTNADTLLGYYGFTCSGNDSGYRLPAYIGSWLEGTTANKRGANIRFYTSPNNSTTQVERMRIDANGQITTPSQTCFLALRNGTQTGIVAGTTIVFNQEAFDIGSNFNTTTGIFTAPVTGKYLFTCTVLLTGLTAGQDIDVTLITSNSAFVFGNPGRLEVGPYITWANDYISFGISQICDMDANDTAYVSVTSLSTGNLQLYSGTDWTRFAGYLLG